MYSIIIVTHNSEKHIHDCIRSIKKHSPANVEIIVVDNSGKSYGLKDIIVNKSGSYPSGLNQGIEEATGDMFVCCNPDVLFVPDWLPKMQKLYDKGFSIVGPLANFSSGIQGYPLTWSRQVKSIEVNYFIGFCFMLSRIGYGFVGSFDEQFEFENDDIDYSIRALKHGLRIGITPYVKVLHVGHQSYLRDVKNVEKRWLSFYRLFNKYPDLDFKNYLGCTWQRIWFSETAKRYPDVKNLKSYQMAWSNS